MRLILAVLMCLLTVPCFAKVVVVVDKATKEIKSVSPEHDAVLQPGDEEVILNEEWPLDLTYQPEFYKLDGKKIKVNTNKLEAAQAEGEQEQEMLIEMNDVDQEARFLACQSLAGKGKVFKHIQCSQFEHK